MLLITILLYWAGDGIRTHDLLLGKETYYHCTTPAIFGQPSAVSAETQDRTGDTAIFSRVLYQLSYLGESSLSLSVRDFTRTYRDCQENISNNKDAHGFCQVCSTGVILSMMKNQLKVAHTKNRLPMAGKNPMKKK